jgi:hypothetical protein
MRRNSQLPLPVRIRSQLLLLYPHSLTPQRRSKKYQHGAKLVVRVANRPLACASSLGHCNSPIQATGTHSSRSVPLHLYFRHSRLILLDYILQLRAHCKQGQPAHGEEDIGHYLDLVSYWREQCQKAQDESDRLRGINIRLERSNHLLSQRTTETEERPGTAPSIGKRKGAVSPTRSPKRPKPPPFKTEQTVAQTQESIENDYGFLEGLGDGESHCRLACCCMPELADPNVFPDGTTLINALYTTHQLCRAAVPDAEVLCYQLVRTTSSLGKVIHLVAHNYEHLARQGQRNTGALSLAEDRSDFSLALTISARAFMSVLVGITTMMDASRDDRLPGLIICELAETFKTALLAIEQSAHQTANSFSSTSSSASAPPKSSKSKATTGVVKESIAARSLAHFLISLMGLLDKTNTIHQRIFDAFAFLLIERVGKRLYYCTFGRHRSENTEACLTPLPESTDSAAKAKQNTEALGIRLELKALVLILERAMGLAPHHMNPPTSKAAKNSNANRIGRTLSMKTLPAAPKGRLSSLAKDRLQRTLVTCMYGQNQNDEFLDVLTKPIPSMRIGTLQNVAKIDDKDVEQWYKEEVWRLVGWDIMARETGW